MSLIYTIQDPTIKLPELRVQLRDTSSEEMGQPEPTNTGMQQTKVFGVMMPLLAVNGIVINYGNLQSLLIDATGHYPLVEFSFLDSEHRFSQLINAGNENELQIQILPPFDDAYKKINMLFYITDIHVDGDIVSGKASLKLPALNQSQFQALGEMTTYELFETVANDTGLGFASNIEFTDDKRQMYCSFKSYLDIVEQEVEKSEASATRVLDWWIDLWNNLILCDIYDRFNSEDSMEDNLVWICDRTTQGAVQDEAEPTLVEPIFSNSDPIVGNSEMKVCDYTIVNNPGTGYAEGTQKVSQVYDMERRQWVDNYIADGDVEKDATLKYEYGGEFYGGYNYVLTKKCRDMYLQKMNAETIVLGLSKPFLGINRGEQVRLVWFDDSGYDQQNREQLESVGLPSQTELDNLGWLADYVSSVRTDDISPLQVNLQVSGQYTVIGQKIIYNNDVWGFELTLTRPGKTKVDQLPEQ